MALQQDWDALTRAFDARWPDGHAKPGLSPRGHGYEASIDTPDGPMVVDAAGPRAALAALATDISGAPRDELVRRLTREEARRRKTRAEADLAAAQADIDANGP